MSVTGGQSTVYDNPKNSESEKNNLLFLHALHSLSQIVGKISYFRCDRPLHNVTEMFREMSYESFSKIIECSHQMIKKEVQNHFVPRKVLYLHV